MELIYEGVNITNRIVIAGAEVHDVSGGRSDSMLLTLNRALDWYCWDPKPDDRIELRHNGWSSGEMYLAAIAPEKDQFRILATAAKSGARQKKNRSFENMTIGQILRICANECGMGYRIFGIDEKSRIPYVWRQGESAAAFLNRIAAWEGAVLKTYAGRFTMIGIREAQKLPAHETITIAVNQEGINYAKQENKKYRTLTIKTADFSVTARDSDAKWGTDKTRCDLPASDAAVGNRWANGILLTNNRKTEELMIESTLHLDWTAMIRVDVAGRTDAAGQWIIDECTHDLMADRSTAKLLRVQK